MSELLKPLHAAVPRLPSRHLVELVRALQSALWADGPDTQWTPETIETVAQVLENAGLGPSSATLVSCAPHEASANDRAIARAREQATDELELDDEPRTSRSEGGTWVQCWLWVPDED